MNYYEYLGISMNASFDEIDKAYKKLALKFHPDINSGDKYFEEQFKMLNQAHSVLSDADKRQQYDISLINETNKHYKIEELKRKAEEKELEILKQIEIRKRQKEAYERQLQTQQQSQAIITSPYKNEQKPIKREVDKRKFWRQAVNVMWVIVIGLGIVILSTKKGEWKNKSKEIPTNNSSIKTTPQRELKSKVKNTVEKKSTNKEPIDTIKTINGTKILKDVKSIDSLLINTDE